MKAALCAQLKDSNNWVDALSVVLLGIHSTPKEDLAHSPAELAYGMPLHLTGKLSSSTNTPEPTADNFLSQLCTNLHTLHPQQRCGMAKELHTWPKNYKWPHTSSSDMTCTQSHFNAPMTDPLKCLCKRKSILHSSYVDEQTRYQLTDLNQPACVTWDVTSTHRSKYRTHRGTTHCWDISSIMGPWREPAIMAFLLHYNVLDKSSVHLCHASQEFIPKILVGKCVAASDQSQQSREASALCDLVLYVCIVTLWNEWHVFLFCWHTRFRV